MKADRDILVKLVVKKVPLHITYLAQRHARTDFPALTCAVSDLNGTWGAVVGARPKKAVLIKDENHLVTEVNEDSAKAFGKYVAEKLSFESNMRGSAEYREMICEVLVKRALLAAGGES